MSAATGTDATRLRRVFELERERGYDNKAVMGGLDRMLIQMIEDGLLTAASPLGQRFKQLPRSGYRSLDDEERKSWIEGTIRALSAPTTRPFSPSPAATTSREPRERMLESGREGRASPQSKIGNRKSEIQLMRLFVRSWLRKD